MLKALSYESLDALIDAAVPGSVRSLDDLDLPPAGATPGAGGAPPLAAATSSPSR